MDVDISQVGQNFALQGVGNAAPRQVLPSEESEAQASKQRSVQETDKVAENSADKSEQSGSNSVNIESAVAEISEFVQSQNRSLAFSVDEKSQRSVVEVKDTDSGEVIRQIPSEEVLALSERIKELQTDVGAAVGVLFNKQV